MKFGFLAAGALFLTLAFSGCDSKQVVKANWIADPHEAARISQKENKPLLIAFTGSDWSPASQSMQAEVLDTPQFKDFADKYLVLYQADFPRGKDLPPPVVAQNVEWAKQSVVDAYPTYLVLSTKNGGLNYMGRMVGTMQGEQFLAQLRQILGVVEAPAGDASGTP